MSNTQITEGITSLRSPLLTNDELDVIWAKQLQTPFKTHGEDRIDVARAIEAAVIPYAYQVAKTLVIKEREACATICDSLMAHAQAARSVLLEAATAIRARGQNEDCSDKALNKTEKINQGD